MPDSDREANQMQPHTKTEARHILQDIVERAEHRMVLLSALVKMLPADSPEAILARHALALAAADENDLALLADADAAR
jgi:hypothetical protein